MEYTARSPGTPSPRSCAWPSASFSDPPDILVPSVVAMRLAVAKSSLQVPPAPAAEAPSGSASATSATTAAAITLAANRVLGRLLDLDAVISLTVGVAGFRCTDRSHTTLMIYKREPGSRL